MTSASGRPGRVQRLRDLRKTSGERLEEELYRRSILKGATHIAEFPKSGGTWIRGMVLDLYRETGPAPRVIHHHWPYRRDYKPAMHLIRDGRDVVISLYHHNARLIRLDTYWARRVNAHFERILGPRYDLEDVASNLPAFIRGLAVDPFGGFLRPRRRAQFLSWPDHAASWLGREGTLTIRYEDVLRDPMSELAALGVLLGCRADTERLRSICAQHEFTALTGRRPGEEDRSAFLRKGVAGEWRAVFSREASEAFNEYGGRALIALGYERDDSWVSYPGAVAP